LLTIFIAFEIAQKRVHLSLSHENAIAALHKAGLKGPTIKQEMGHSLSTIYDVLKCFKQRGTVENKERSGRPSLLTLRDTVTRKLYGVVKSDRKRQIREDTNIFNEHRARPVSDRTVQRKLYETNIKCVVKKKRHQNSRLQCQKTAGVN
jgi:transposase